MTQPRPNGVPRKCIVVTGLPGSGKSTAASYISSTYGIPVVSAGDVFRGMAQAAGIAGSRQNLQEIGIEFLSEHGETGLGALLLAAASPSKAVIIEGVRPPGTVEYIREHVHSCLVLFIDASANRRKQRIDQRAGSAPTQESGSIEIPLEQQAAQIRHIADTVINNDGTPAELEAALKSAVDAFF